MNAASTYAASTFPSQLVGRVYHIISKNDVKSCDNKKRPRAWNGRNESPADSIVRRQSSSNFHRGFVFIPEGLESECTDRYISNGNGFPLVIPYSSLRAACFAASAKKFIQISRYSLIRYGDDGLGELIFSSPSTDRSDVINSECSGSGINFVLEVHHDGLRVIPSENDECIERLNKSENEVPSITLEALAREESQNMSPSGFQSTKKRSIVKDPMNVTGTVDAISPILINASHEEPFAIMELYQLPNDDAGTDVKSAVAVIRGEQALCMHPAIHPGQSITLIGVVSRKWKVPDEIQKHLNSHEVPAPRNDLYQRLNHRVPYRVLLISGAKDICWNDEHDLAGSPDMSLPSTVESLSSIRGIVKSVHYHISTPKDGKRASRAAHFVDLTLLTPAKEDTQSGRYSWTTDHHISARIYLLKYAMPPCCALGLQPGCILRAVNIHFIPPSENAALCENVERIDTRSRFYVACLRSTLAIERCAGESRHRPQSSISRFVPREKAFVLVPDHRITDMCCDPFNTKSTTQLFTEKRLRRVLETKFDAVPSSSHETPDVVEHAQRPVAVEDNGSKRSEHFYSTHSPEKVDALLAHHHRTVKLNEEIFQGKGRKKRMSNKTNGEQIMRLTIRNPYAEFFDHAHNDSSSSATECGSSYNETSCFNHYHHFEFTSTPFVVSLEHLRNACAQNFINRAAIYCQSRLRDIEQVKATSTVSSGWTTSYHYTGLCLLQILNDYERSQSTNRHSKTWYDVSNDSMHNIYVWGRGTGTASFRDEACEIPICKIRDRAGLHAYQQDYIDLPTWMQVGAVVVSCLCLGPSRNAHEAESIAFDHFKSGDDNRSGSSHRVFPHSFLPSIRADMKTVNTDGHGFVFLVGNLVFIASVHIAAKSFVSIDRNKILRENARVISALQKPCEIAASGSSFAKLTDSMSVQKCLERTASAVLPKNPAFILGRLMRQRWTFRRLNHVQIGGQLKKCFGGWTVALSHIDQSASDSAEGASVLQTIEVGISIEFDELTQIRSDSLKHAIQRLNSTGTEVIMQIGDPVKIITPDQVTMGLAWWIASESSRTAPLLSGGLALNPSVHLEIPYTLCTFSNLGYQRFRCNLNDMTSFFFSERRRSQQLSAESPHSASTYGSTDQFLQGMLTRRLGRMPPSSINKIPGALDPLIHPRNQLTLLTRLKCQGGVPSATLAELHWDICTSLRARDNSHLKPSLLRRIHNTKVLGISFCRAQVECTLCFKTLTSGRPSKCPTSHPNVTPISALEKSLEATILFCPSGCSRSHGAVKWECSALIDDGTGQARIYADRESALLLLGDRLNVEAIEKGAWVLDDGVFFQPALPASSYLMRCIKDASIKARRCTISSDNNGERKNGRSSSGVPLSIFNLLPAAAKAEYHLQQHCRHWYQHHHQRKMDLFCRCKPLSNDVTSVNQTEIQVAKAWIAKVGIDFGAAPTASLPPLNLIFEDACLAAEESCGDNIAGWGILASFMNHTPI